MNDKNGTSHPATIRQSLTELSQTINSTFSTDFVEQIKAVFEDLGEQLYKILQAVKVALDRLPPELQQLIPLLADRGWFVSDEIPVSILPYLKKQFELKNLGRVDECMANCIREVAPSILSSAIKDFPRRTEILSAAFKAYDAKEYALSIPILLIQAEGICQDILSVKLFSKKKGVPVTKSALEPLPNDPLTEAMLSPLMTGCGITANENERQEYPNAFNRHEILHGIDVEYASEINALKAISLLGYMVTAVAEAASKKVSVA
jgi:hypothetical protein